MKLHNIFFSIIILVLSYFTIAPLFHTGFFPMHDNTQVQRVYEMGKGLEDGMIPVRWVSDLGYGYGYPIFTFYAPLAYYIGGITSFVMSPLFATKIMIGLGIVLSGVFMFIFSQKIFGKSGGLAAAIFYLYAPYHAVDIYVRGDIAEMWAYAFVPLAFYGFYKISEESSWKHVLIAALGFAGIILSHNLTALMVTPFLVAFALLFSLLSQTRLYTIRYTLYAFLLGLGLSAFYSLPVFAEMKYTNVLSQIGGSANFKDHFVCLSQLWQSQWGYGGSTKGCIDGLSFMVGKIHIILSFFSLLSIPFVWKKNKKIVYIVLFCIFSFLTVCYLMLSQSLFIWEVFKPMAFLQYPWRFLLLASFFASILSGACIFLLSIFLTKQLQRVVITSILVGVIFLYSKYFVPQTYTTLPSNWYTSQKVLFDTSKISDEYMPPRFGKPKVSPTSLLAGNVTQITIINKTQEKKVLVNLPKDESIGINIAYFPAWKATVDGVNIPLLPEKSGMQLRASKGAHIIDIYYMSTLIELFGNILTLTSAFILILVIMSEQVNKKYVSNSS